MERPSLVPSVSLSLHLPGIVLEQKTHDGIRVALGCEPVGSSADASQTHDAGVRDDPGRLFIEVRQGVEVGVQDQCGTEQFAQTRTYVMPKSGAVPPIESPVVLYDVARQQVHEVEIRRYSRLAFRGLGRVRDHGERATVVPIPRPQQMLAVAPKFDIGGVMRQVCRPLLVGEQGYSGENRVCYPFGMGAFQHFERNRNPSVRANHGELVDTESVDRSKQHPGVISDLRWGMRRVGETVAGCVEGPDLSRCAEKLDGGFEDLRGQRRLVENHNRRTRAARRPVVHLAPFRVDVPSLHS